MRSAIQLQYRQKTLRVCVEVGLDGTKKPHHGCSTACENEVRQWLSSYFKGRYQRATVLGETSDTLPVSSGPDGISHLSK